MAMHVPAPVLLDRDGTIVVDADYPRDPTLVRFIPGAERALRELSRLGHPLAVVSNQSGVGRGLVTRAEADAVHQRFLKLLADAGIGVAGVYYCFHSPYEECDCRKPLPGLLTRAISELRFGAPRFMVGDKPSDIAAGGRAGCATIWLEAGREYPHNESEPDYKAQDWDEVLRIILRQE